MLAGARSPWWVIGSAAVVLHGSRTTVADVDVLLDAGDLDRLLPGLARPGVASARFRSARFARWSVPPLAVEFMAGLHVADASGWSPVRLATREAVTLESAMLYVPTRAELIAMLHRFGRPKDLARAALLNGSAPPGSA